METVGWASLPRRKRLSRSSNSLGRWDVRFTSLSGMVARSLTIFTRLSHSLMVEAHSLSSMKATLSNVFKLLLILPQSLDHALSRHSRSWRCTKLVKTDQSAVKLGGGEQAALPPNAPGCPRYSVIRS